MKRFLSILALGALLFTSNSFASEKKGLNVVLTSGDEQTQMMAMVLSMMTIKAQKSVNITMCAAGGKLALNDTETKVFEPSGKSPTMLLKALLKSGANVNVCPLYLPSIGKDATALIEGISVAKPPVIAAQILDEDYSTLSY